MKYSDDTITIGYLSVILLVACNNDTVVKFNSINKYGRLKAILIPQEQK